MIPDATRPNADRWVKLGEGRALLHYPDGEWRFRHVCDRSSTGRGVIICAPLLDLHQVVGSSQPDAPVTVTPSILCSDCGIHGFVNRSVWEPA